MRARAAILISTFAVVLGALVLQPAASGESPSAIWQAKCASCHGEEGQGAADGFDLPLEGDLTVDELAELIERTMPEGAPEECVGEEARQVAAYIYDEFYSLEARQRKGLAPAPRVELTRLTIQQYRNAVADLIGRFTPEPARDERPDRRRRRGRRGRDDDGPRRERFTPVPDKPQPGLRAEYFQSDGMNKADDLWNQRVDRRLDFDFGQYSPVEGITADQFAIIWQGSLLAPDTGHYEFRIRTENGARLYLNNDPAENRRGLRDDSSVAGQSAFIDAWVGSGKMREKSERVFLLGGRQYPIRLEFFKYLEESASVRLEWKPPHGTWEVLDHRHLTTAPSKRVFVVDTPFPADDASLGYERGTAVSREWHSAATNAAITTAAEVVGRLPLLAGVSDGQGDDEDETAERNEQIDEFLARFASVAFRRPLSSEEREFFREFVENEPAGPDAAVRRAVLLILTSPYFLYTELTPAGEAPSQYAIASRLALTLWDSIPDEPLLDAAADGKLGTAEEVEAQARRMLSDPRVRAKMRGFFHHWLEFEERDLAKDKEMFPDFDEAVVADLRYSLETFLEQVLWSESSDYRELLLADYLILNDRLRKLYGLDSKDASESESDAAQRSSAEFARIDCPPERRAGVLTHPYLLSAFAYHNNTSPIHRGVFLTRNIVGRPLKPPPVAVAFKENEFPPDLTMREKITQLTRDTACMSCHSIINPLGFALESYDAVGRWRTIDNDKPIDTKSQYTSASGETLDVAGARDIAEFAVRSEAARQAFVAQMFHHLVKQNPAAYGLDTIDRLRAEFASDEFHMQNLMVRIAVRAAMHSQQVSQTSTSTASQRSHEPQDEGHEPTKPHTPTVSP